MENLKKEITKKITKKHMGQLKEIEAIKKSSQIFENWTLTELLTKLRRSQLENGKLLLSDAKFLMISKAVKNYKKELGGKMKFIDDVANAPDLKDVTLSIEWKKSYVWGNNPTCEAKMNTLSSYEYFSSGSIGGCGYDKESTAVSKVLNQSKSVLKELYKIKNKPCNVKKKNHDVFGYGSGYNILPCLEGGVGVNCYYHIFEKCGFIFKHVAMGKTFDVYEVNKK
jgi:hypothetical protein